MKTYKFARVPGALGGLFGLAIAGLVLGMAPAQAEMGGKPQETAAPVARQADGQKAGGSENAAPARDRFDGQTDIVLGQADAPITVIEYASMTCSHCAEFHAKVFPEFKKQWIDTGKAKFILRHFVLNGPDLTASMIARCSADDRRYFALVDLFFRRQSSWIQPWQAIGQPAADAKLSDLAIQAKMDDFVRPAGISTNQVRECLDSERLRNDLLKVRGEGQSQYNITGTPTLIINGKVYTGDHEFAEFDKALSAAR